MHWPLVVAAMIIAVTILAGFWQLERARDKAEIESTLERLRSAPPLSIAPGENDPADYYLRRVEARGVFDPQSTIYLDNKLRRGIAGYEIVSLLRMEGGRRPVLVNRGWIAGGPRRENLPSVPVPQGEVTIEGIAVPSAERVLELSGEATQGKVWQNLDPRRYEERLGVEVQPFILRQENDTADGLVRDWRAPSRMTPAMHRGYALTWFSLAALTAVFYLAVGRKK
jgi:surfeit locus 1 family protein